MERLFRRESNMPMLVAKVPKSAAITFFEIGYGTSFANVVFWPNGNKLFRNWVSAPPAPRR